MKGTLYDCVIDKKIKLSGLQMKELVKNINEILERDYNGLIEMNSTKIYNLINRPKCVSKGIRKLLEIEYALI